MRLLLYKLRRHNEDHLCFIHILVAIAGIVISCIMAEDISHHAEEAERVKI